MYPYLLLFHSYLRWVIIFYAAFILIKSAMNLKSHNFTMQDRKSALFFMVFYDFQFLLGLFLYFLAPGIVDSLKNMAVTMKDPTARFWAVEHSLGMIISWILVHIGYAKAKKISTGKGHKIILVFYGIALLIALVSIPWVLRPLFRV